MVFYFKPEETISGNFLFIPIVQRLLVFRYNVSLRVPKALKQRFVRVLKVRTLSGLEGNCSFSPSTHSETGTLTKMPRAELCALSDCEECE